VVAPVMYPWYALWPLAFVPLLRGRAGWAALAWSATLPLGYLVWQRADWRLSGALLLAEYAPVYVAVAIEIVVALRATKKGDTSVAPTAARSAATALPGPAATASCR